MKKFGFIISALALVLGLSQCRKPDTSIWHNNGLQTQTIEFTASYNGGEKGDFDDVGNALKYKWDINNTDGKIDKLYVYAQTTEDATFTGGSFVGTLPIVNVSDGGYTANFAGKISVPSGGIKYLRFVHYGQDISVGENGAASVDFSTQDGTLPSISKKVVAVYDTQYNESLYQYSGRLVVQFAVAKLKFEEFKLTKGIIITGMGATGLSVANTGVITNNSNKSSKLDARESIGDSLFYTVFMPETNKYRFCTKIKMAEPDNNWTFEKNKYYTKEVGDNNYAILIKGVTWPYLLGEFTVKGGANPKKVYFLKGNLYYDYSDDKWRIEKHQYDYRTNHTSSFKVLIDGNHEVTTPEGDWGLLGRPTQESNYGTLNSADPTYFNGTFRDWGQYKTIYYGDGEGDTIFCRSSRVLAVTDKKEWGNLLYTASGDASGNFHDDPIPGGRSELYGAVTITDVKAYAYDYHNNLGLCPVYGILLLPDSSNYYKRLVKQTGDITNITSDELDKSGAVFLPAGGSRGGIDADLYYNQNFKGNYWMLTKTGDKYYYVLVDHNGPLFHFNNANCFNGLSVRLVVYDD